MTTKELNLFVETDEGQTWLETMNDAWVQAGRGAAWLNEQKEGLLNKNSELLDKLSKGNAELKTVNERIQGLESDLNKEREWARSQLIDNEINRFFDTRCKVPSIARPLLADSIKKTYGLSVIVDGEDRKATGIIKDDDTCKNNGIKPNEQAPLSDILEHWARCKDNAEYVLSLSTGGGATGSGFTTGAKKPDLSSMSGQALAQMSDAEFGNLRNEALKQ